MGLLSLIFLICALRTNIIFVTIFFGLFMTFILLAGSYWRYAIDDPKSGLNLQIVSPFFQNPLYNTRADSQPNPGIRRVRLPGMHGWLVSTNPPPPPHPNQTANKSTKTNILTRPGGFYTRKCSRRSISPFSFPSATSAISSRAGAPRLWSGSSSPSKRLKRGESPGAGRGKSLQ